MPKYYSQREGYTDTINIKPRCGAESYEGVPANLSRISATQSVFFRTVHVLETALLAEALENLGLIIYFLAPPENLWAVSKCTIGGFCGEKAIFQAHSSTERDN